VIDIAFAINLIGWVGSAAVILAYILVSADRLKGDSEACQMLNLFGGVFLIANTIYWGAYPSTFVNLVWVGIAILAIARAIQK
jgi:hypothetical protein